MKKRNMIRGLLVHLSYNMWSDRDYPEWNVEHIGAKPYLRFDESLWNDLLMQASHAGVNTVVLDLGDGVRYHSHPEIAVQGAWDTQKLREEIRKMRDLGLEPLPKLNFSSCHDTWLGSYARMVSTPVYYQVCRDLIAEVNDLFDGPRLFHLGMDEETAEHQRHYEYVVVRQYDLWWHDLLFYLEEVNKAGSRPWVWSDYIWQHPQLFYQNMPRTVLQSNWYYGQDFGPASTEALAYDDLEAHGYDQVPTGSNWTVPDNMRLTVEHCQKAIAPEHLNGFLMSVWKPTLEICRKRHEEAIQCLAQAKMAFTNRDI
jgi:hypothetical protein